MFIEFSNQELFNGLLDTVQEENADAVIAFLKDLRTDNRLTDVLRLWIADETAIVDDSQHNILHVLASSKNIENVKVVIEELRRQGMLAELLTTPNYPDQNLPLHMAAYHHNVEMVKLMIGELQQINRLNDVLNYRNKYDERPIDIVLHQFHKESNSSEEYDHEYFSIAVMLTSHLGLDDSIYQNPNRHNQKLKAIKEIEVDRKNAPSQITALAMVTHPRLGKDSSAKTLDRDTLEVIAKQLKSGINKSEEKI